MNPETFNTLTNCAAAVLIGVLAGVVVVAMHDQLTGSTVAPSAVVVAGQG